MSESTEEKQKREKSPRLRDQILALVLAPGRELAQTVEVDVPDVLADGVRGHLGQGAGSAGRRLSTHAGWSRAQGLLCFVDGRTLGGCL